MCSCFCCLSLLLCAVFVFSALFRVFRDPAVAFDDFFQIRDFMLGCFIRGMVAAVFDGDVAVEAFLFEDVEEGFKVYVTGVQKSEVRPCVYPIVGVEVDDVFT